VIGYLDVLLQEPLGYVGGVLIADEYGLPVEFRHTLPVRPTKLQRALYGSALDRYLRTVVITQRLLGGLEHDPVLVLVADPALVTEAAVPLAHVTDAGVDPVGAVGTISPFTGAAPGFLLQLRPGEAPLRVVTEAPPHLYPDLGRELIGGAETMDINEPMLRVKAGLALIAAGDVSAAA
jgi:hypothetical protein